MSRHTSIHINPSAGRTAPAAQGRSHGDIGAVLNADTKLCPSCQRPFANRKKWASRGLWPAIVYCSKRCRQAKRRP